MNTHSSGGKVKRSWLANGLLAVVSLLLATLAIEMVMRWRGQQPLTMAPGLRRSWAYHTTLGWAHRPGHVGTFGQDAGRVSIRINSLGLRDREMAYGRTEGRGRILVVGDSFAWGFGVEADQIFTERMETRLSDVDVLNAGVSGYSTDQELLWLENDGMKYQPDLVLLLLSGNDDALNRRSVAYFVYPKPFFDLTPGGDLVLRNVPVPRASLIRRLAYSASRRSSFINFAVGRVSVHRSALTRRTEKTPSSDAPEQPSAASPYALTTALIERMRDTATAGGARFLVVATGMFWSGGSPGTFEDLLTELTSRHFDILNIEADPGFQPQAMRLPGDGHWNAAGHDFVAKQILHFIERRELLAP